MTGHDSIAPSAGPYHASLRGTPVPATAPAPGGDAFDANHAAKRRRDAPTSNWEQGVKRQRRDDFDQPEQPGSGATQYTQPTSLYDSQLGSRHYSNPPSNNSTPYIQQAAFSNAPSPYPQPNIDPAIQAYPSGPQQQYRDQDTTFGAYPQNHPNHHFVDPWGMQQQHQNHNQQQQQQQQQQQAQPSRAYQNSPDQFYPQNNAYAASPVPSQPPYAASISAQDWTQPSYTYNGGADQWNYQIDEPTVYGDDASLHLKIQSIPTLDNLSTQIIVNLAKGSLPDILLLTAGRNYEESQAYFTRRALFDQTRKVFSRSSVFIDLHAASNMFTPSQQEVVRKANRATFISSILEGHDISFYDLDSRFLDTFVPTGQRLLKWQGTVLLELKTQAYIAAMMNNDGPPEVLLNELFPADMEQRIIARHPDAANIAPSEQDFLDRARARKQYLFNEPPYEALHNLRQKYGWQDFLREFASCINKNVEAIINNPARTPSSASFSPQVPRLSQSPAARYQYYSPHVPQQRSMMSDSHAPPPQQQRLTPQPQATNQHVQNVQQQHDARTSASSTPDPGEGTASPHHKVKPGKAAKAGSGTGTPRQPWKQEEEDALLAGLAEVKGPHWSQILSLYGRGGSVSEVLKDRNQIQLKDKARNLKLWYLKMGNEVPVCLRGVTGELRKRGGARVRAALGLTDDDDAIPSKKTKITPLPKTQGAGAKAGAAGVAAAPPTGQIDPSLGE